MSALCSLPCRFRVQLNQLTLMIWATREEMIWLDDETAAPSFNPTRLTLARERRGLTKQALADCCGVTRRTVTAWESGDVDNPPVDIISESLEFPVFFFFADDPCLIPEESV